METTKENTGATCAPEPITAEEILISIIGWEPLSVRENLHEIMCVFFMYNQNHDEEFMDSMYCTYRVLFDALLKMEQYRKERGLLEPKPMNQENESCLSREQLSAEILRLKEDNHRLNKDYGKSLDDCIQLQNELLDRFQPGRKSKECLAVAFRGSQNQKNKSMEREQPC